ncbi:MAG: hypothetical protein VX620_04030 [Pseudomonadota bacterium]|nr:hypothetical protein [Pseudomonadota bacterium]
MRKPDISPAFCVLGDSFVFWQFCLLASRLGSLFCHQLAVLVRNWKTARLSGISGI